MTIRKLPEELINQIAAGEVVERPASVVKELVENAIDAGATAIDITLHNGGKSFISITDNGSGMTADDLPMALMRHATSKLNNDDLFHISTMGFRGEALPSIASISRLTLLSGTGDDGASLSIEGGKNQSLKPAPKRRGTKIEVRDLFYATPARLKFLKADKTEFIACREVIERLALVHPTIAFTLTGEQRQVLSFRKEADTTPSSFKNRIADVLGEDFADNNIPVLANRDDCTLTGFISLPTFSKSTAQDQYVYVNNRPVKDKLLYVAIRMAYQDYLMQGRYPVVCLFLSVPPEFVDVNVHPAKSEVRFRDAAFIRDFVTASLRSALMEGTRATSSTLAGDTISRFTKFSAPTQPTANLGAPHSPTKSYPSHPSFSLMENTAPLAREFIYEQVNDPAQLSYPLGAAVAQLHENYIVAQTADGLILVDQHAAHERIVYEQLKAGFAQHGIKRQMLLIPEIVELPAAAFEAISTARQQLEQLGLVFETYGDSAVVVREIPDLFGDGDIRGLIKDLADELKDAGQGFALEKNLLHIAATIACHGSVRAGRKLNIAEMNALLRQMEAAPNTGQCNHGRPTYIKLKLSDVESLFKRS